MGIFGPSKQEVALSNEINFLKSEIARLKGLLTPDQQKAEFLKDQIMQLELSMAEKASNVSQLFDRTKQLNLEIERLNAEIRSREKIISIYDTDISVHEYGLYKPTFEFANSDLYKDKLKQIRDKQKDLIKSDQAVRGSANWTVDGSVTKGRALVNDNKKLLLRAFNVECDDIVSNVKVSNIDRSIERIYRISEQISKLGKTMSIAITNSYINLKVQEVNLALDFQQKKTEEKERLKELRAQEREEAKALREIEEEKKRLLKEQNHYQNALSSLMTQIQKYGETPDLLEKKLQLESQIGDTITAIENVDYRAANRKAGYVYIISNIGAFGENVYKIGMTRRLDPQERVDELGDASVPFNFDVHAMIFTEDAPKLEAALHSAFESKKINKINTRREFFNVTLEEIKSEVRNNFDKTVEWIDIPEAEQYRQSKLM